jgi:hypothetical protein
LGEGAEGRDQLPVRDGRTRRILAGDLHPAKKLDQLAADEVEEFEVGGG